MKKSRNPAKQPKEYFHMAKASKSSAKVKHKTMRGKKPGKCESLTANAIEQARAEILASIEVKKARAPRVYYDAAGRAICASPSYTR